MNKKQYYLKKQLLLSKGYVKGNLTGINGTLPLQLYDILYDHMDILYTLSFMISRQNYNYMLYALKYNNNYVNKLIFVYSDYNHLGSKALGNLILGQGAYGMVL